MRSAWPTIASFGASALVMVAIALLGAGFLTLFALLAAAILTTITFDMTVRAYRSRNNP